MPVEVARNGRREPEDDAGPLRIGLINNMPDAALRATERQFTSLLDCSAGGTEVRLYLYALPEISRGRAAQRHIDSCYSDAASLFGSSLDGLIVTGSEPRAADLRQEPYWGSLARIVEWAEQHTQAAIWSCLAAHAAVLHLDGIERRRLDRKLFGIFECVRAEEDALTEGVPACYPVPHSRWNDVAEGDLTRCSYRVLSRDRQGGVDSFVKRRGSLFLFFQGHPEYEAATLQLEYRRDLEAYARHGSGPRPNMPANMPEGYGAGEKQANAWTPAARGIYKNWIDYLRRQRRNSGDASSGSAK